MDSDGKFTRLTPKKFSKNSENSNPNVEHSPGISKSVTKTQKSVCRNPNTSQFTSISPKSQIRHRKFVIAKKKKCSTDNSNISITCKSNNKAIGEKKKCLCVAYESLRVSQEEFFKNGSGNECGEEDEFEKLDNVNGGGMCDGQGMCNEALIQNVSDSPVRGSVGLTSLVREVTIPVSVSEGVKLGDCFVEGESKEMKNELLIQNVCDLPLRHSVGLATLNQDVKIAVSVSEGVNLGDCCVKGESKEVKNELLIQNVRDLPVRHSVGLSIVDQEGIDELGGRLNEDGCSGKLTVGTIKRRRERLLEEARKSVPEPGSGRVMHLVKAFDKLLSIRKSNKSEEKGKEDENETEDSRKGQKWALPGLQTLNGPQTQVSSSSFCPSDFFITPESLGLDSHRASSFDRSHRRVSSRTSGGGRRIRRNSAESSRTFARRSWKRRQLKATSQKPFKLRTEERGKCKEEEFLKKVQQMVEEEEKQRIPIAQGLPWTTDAPECLPKPPVKESTRPVDIVLHSDVRAVERAEFDHQVAEKLNLIEQYKMERERLRKMAEEEEVRQLRKELIPKAQPMPYFDRPFVPRRSTKNPTIPREPKFHIPQHKKIKCCMSWNDMYIHDKTEWGCCSDKY